MKTLKNFNLFAQNIMQQIQTYNDRPNPPGGNNIKHTDAGSITGNTCKFATDPGNIGGKTDTCQGLCDEDMEGAFKFNIGDTVIFIDDPFVEGEVIDRVNFYGNLYAVDFPPEPGRFQKTTVYPENKLKFPIDDRNPQIVEDACCAAPAAMGTVNVMGPTPGMPSIADTAGGSRAAEKAPTDPGVTTKDISQVYSPALNRAPKDQKQKKQKYPLFSRLKK